MKIAIVAPSPVPFRIGGIENLVWSICDYINKETNHSADLIKLPSHELDFWSLIDNYKQFYDLDLSHFDAVITSKYPCWMIRHDNVVTYMAHCLRGLYDCYFMMNLPHEVDRNNHFINQVLDYMEKNPNPASLDEFFDMVYSLKRLEIPAHYFGFPGPFIRLLVHYMDRFGMSYSKRKNFFAISDTVKKRTEYFPVGANIKTLYPESEKQDTTEGNYEYVFMISRLDNAKRIDLLVKAMKYVKADIKLKIAGTGPCADELKALAGDDKRIEFLGFVKDEDVTKLYANALVIPYFPYDEDYGYITAEAMMHKKPIITTKDAGGPTEFTVDNETGFVVDTDPEAIAKAIDYFASNPDEAKRMGANAYEKVKDISWEGVVKELVAELETKMNRKKIVVPVSFGVYPPKGGGQARIFNLYKNVANLYDVILVTNNYDLKTPVVDGKIANGVREIKVQASGEFIARKQQYDIAVKTATDDSACLVAADLNTSFNEELKKALKVADLVIMSHPYMYENFKSCGIDVPFVYEAHNVEYLLKKEMYGDSPEGKELAAAVFEAEKECCIKSEFIITCSEEDAVKLCEVYGCEKDKIIVVPNGVDCDSVEFISVADRIKNKKAAGIEDKVGIFMGSWHNPNLEACEEIFKMSKDCPDTMLMLMGSQCLYFTNNGTKIPGNVGLLGMVSEEEKARIFSMVDFALNPMMSGSGTNLKMFDYMAGGIPVITTKFGTRGIEDKSGMIIAEVDEMAEAINKFSLEESSDMVVAARKHMEEVFDWKVIAKTYLDKLEEILK